MKKFVNAACLTGPLIIVILLAGCAPSATQYAPLPPDLNVAPASGKARICVIRGFVVLVGMDVGCRLQDDGVPIGELTNGSYICWERPPGVAQLSLRNGDPFFGSQGTLSVKTDMLYYLYMDYFHQQLKSISHQEGLKYLAEYPKPRVLVRNAAPSASPGPGVGAPAIGNQIGGIQGSEPISPHQKGVGY